MTEYPNTGGDEMTDYQFKRYEEYRDKCDALEKENECLRRNAPRQGETGMTDFQYKQIIEMIYQIIKANIEAGKSSVEILEIIAALKK